MVSADVLVEFRFELGVQIDVVLIGRGEGHEAVLVELLGQEIPIDHLRVDERLRDELFLRVRVTYPLNNKLESEVASEASSDREMRRVWA